MSEKVQHHIYDLIHSMQKSERRYFKIYASKHVIGEENNYEALFDFLAVQKSYDEIELRKHFSGQPMLNNLTITLHRLYEHLLKALDAYHSSTSVDLELRHLFNYAEILFNKSLYSACFKMCKKIKKLAVQHDRQTAIIEHNGLIKKLFEVENYENIRGGELDEILESDRATLSELTRISELWFVKSTILNKLNVEGTAKSEEDRQFFLEFTSRLNAPQSDLFEAQYLFFHARAASAFALGLHAECILFINQNFSLFERFPDKKEAHLSRFISLLGNAIYLHQIQKDFSAARSYLQQLKLLCASYENKLSDDLAIKLFNSTFSIELMMNIHTGNFEENILIIPEIEKRLNAFKGKISVVRETYFYYCFAISHLALNQPKASLKYSNTVLHAPNSQRVQDMLDATKILHLLALTELKEAKLLPHVLKSVKRQLVNQKKWKDFEKLLFRYMDKWVQTEKIWEEEELFADFVDQLEKNIVLYSSSPFYHIFPFKCWAESKFKNRSVAACVQNQLSVLS